MLYHFSILINLFPLFLIFLKPMLHFFPLLFQFLFVVKYFLIFWPFLLFFPRFELLCQTLHLLLQLLIILWYFCNFSLDLIELEWKINRTLMLNPQKYTQIDNSVMVFFLLFFMGLDLLLLSIFSILHWLDNLHGVPCCLARCFIHDLLMIYIVI